jgi:hypothetical protein
MRAGGRTNQRKTDMHVRALGTCESTLSSLTQTQATCTDGKNAPFAPTFNVDAGWLARIPATNLGWCGLGGTTSEEHRRSTHRPMHGKCTRDPQRELLLDRPCTHLSKVEKRKNQRHNLYKLIPFIARSAG